jgi:hypothetical protein
MLAAIAFAAGATALLAADYWQNKPFIDWSDKKEVAKMLTASPWSGQVPLSMSGGGGGGGRGGEGGGMGGGGGMPSRSVTVRWVSALPVKEALLKSKYGAEAGSADAKKMLEQPERQ